MNKRSYVISGLIIMGIIYSMAIRSGGGSGGVIQSGMGRIAVLADDWPICSDAPFEIANALLYTTEWTQTYGGAGDDSASAVFEMADGSFVLAGTTTSYGAGGSDAWLVKTDARGKVEWTQTYGGAGDDSASAVFEMADGGFVLAGTTTSYGAGGSDAWLVKTDARGEVEWTQTYGGPDTERISAAIQTTDGGFALAGRTGAYAWLVKTDARGVMQWSQRYKRDDRDNNGNRPVSVIETLDGGFVLPMLCTYSRGVLSWVLKTDVNGYEEWWINMAQYKVEHNSLGWVYSGIQTEDGGFAFVGDSMLVKTDATGHAEWLQDYGDYDAPADSVIQTTDGGFALAGNTGEDFWVAKIDNQGTMEWRQTYGGSEKDIANAVIEMADGSFVLAGSTNSYGAGGLDAWLVKTIPPESTPPELSAPEDIAYEEGTTGHVITWVVGDRYPGNYTFYTNSVQVNSGRWTNGTIPWNVDGFTQGTYNVTLVVCDTGGNSVSDTVWVTVSAPETPPLPEFPVISILVLLGLAALATLGKRRRRP